MGKPDKVNSNLQYTKMDAQSGLTALFEFATEGILITNERGAIIKANPAAEELFGYERGELLDLKVEGLIPQRFAGKHVDHRQNFVTSPHARRMGIGVELYAQRKNGTEFPAEISLSPYSNDEGKFVIAFIIDITLRKEAEQKFKHYSTELEEEVKQRTIILSEAIAELQKIKEELNLSLAKEKELNELKSRFVSMVSHEFRTPLATILSSLALIRNYVELKDTEKQYKHMDRIKTSVGNLTDILNDVLSLSKLEEGKIVITSETFNIPEFVEEVLQDIQPVIKPGQTLRYVNKNTIQNITLDRKILRHILFNLVTNAVKFSPENKPIQVYTSIQNERFEITIHDEGIGISEEDQKHLFESFYRGQNAVNIPGTGLGLNIVSKYIDLLGGTIVLESELNIGTKFTIQLPFSKP